MHEMRAYWGFDCTYGFRMIISLSGYKLGMELCGWVVGSPELCVSYYLGILYQDNIVV